MKYMNQAPLPYRIFSLGDSALTIDFGNRIDEQLNREVIARYQNWKKRPLPGVIEMVPAYGSLTVHYYPPEVKKVSGERTAFEWMKQALQERLSEPVVPEAETGHLVRIPVCYDPELAPDLHRLAASRNLRPDEVIALHTGSVYKVYMLGFLPGFAYLGIVDERIAMPRKAQPVKVAAGSVGIAGSQTGIYPFDSPGGWHIIGRTPVTLFEACSDNPVLLNGGDRVQFYPVNIETYHTIKQAGK